MKINWRYIVIFLLPLLAACVDPFEPPVDDYQELLVVEAFINDQPEPQVVKLSLSSPIDTARFTPVTGAIVLLTDDSGAEYQFRSDGNGDYISNPGEFVAQPGRTYRLNIQFGNGRNYVSEAVEMKQTPPISDLYYELETFISGDGSLQDGFVVKADVNAQNSEPLYLRFDWEETYMTVPPFPSFFIFDDELQSIEIREDNITECWITRNSSAINLVSTEGTAVNDVRRQVVRYLPFNRAELNYRYSILVRQYAMDPRGYDFWKSLKETNESTGTLFDVQPFPLTGNLKNLDDPDEPVLGYFDMATSSERRIFIDQTDVPVGTGVPTLFVGCINNAGDTIVSPSNVPILSNSGYLISYYLFPTGYVMVPRSCIDCTIYGSNVKPDFWE